MLLNPRGIIFTHTVFKLYLRILIFFQEVLTYACHYAYKFFCRIPERITPESNHWSLAVCIYRNTVINRGTQVISCDLWNFNLYMPVRGGLTCVNNASTWSIQFKINEDELRLFTYCLTDKGNMYKFFYVPGFIIKINFTWNTINPYLPRIWGGFTGIIPLHSNTTNNKHLIALSQESRVIELQTSGISRAWQARMRSVKMSRPFI